MQLSNPERFTIRSTPLSLLAQRGEPFVCSLKAISARCALGGMVGIGRHGTRLTHAFSPLCPVERKYIMTTKFFSGSYFSPKQLGPGSETRPHTKINTLAVAAAVCAALGFVTAVGFLGGVIFGHIALFRIKRSGGQESGRRLTLAAVVISWIPIVLVALIFGLLFLVGLVTVAQEG